jgi:hypothetical protein
MQWSNQMAQHGYLREYDEGWDRSDDRGRRNRDEWRADRGDWRDRDPVWRRDRENERGRGFMLDDDGRDYFQNRDEDRGFFSRMGDEARSWFRDDDRQDRSAWENNRDWPKRRTYSANPDDHYRSWRDRQMQSLDRDYEDYCREREQQFHRDFDSWRQNRQQTRGSTGQQELRHGDPEELLLSERTRGTPDALNEPQATVPSPEAAATLGENNPENTPTGRRRG